MTGAARAVAAVTPDVTTRQALAHLSLSGLGRDLAASLVIGVAVIAIGFTLRHLLLRSALSDPLADATVAIGLGVTGYGAVVLLIGSAPLLRPVPLVEVTLAAACLLFWTWPEVVATARGLARDLAGAVRAEWIVAIPVALFVAIAVLAGFRPPQASDEIAYHWPAPELWAGVGHWVVSPFRFTNSFDLAEVLYTPAAVFRSSTAAHWTDTGTFLLLAVGAGALARRFGGLAGLTCAAVIAIPAAAGESWLAYNDVFAASLLMAACVVVTSSTMAVTTGSRTRSRSRGATPPGDPDVIGVGLADSDPGGSNRVGRSAGTGAGSPAGTRATTTAMTTAAATATEPATLATTGSAATGTATATDPRADTHRPAGSAARTYWTAGILMGAAISVKPIMVLLAPLPVILAMVSGRERSGGWTLSGQARVLVPLAVPTVVASLGWFAYSKAVTGRWFQSTGLVVAKFGHDPSFGLATIRIPTFLEAVAMPFLPMATGIIGQHQPYGGRTGLVLVVFIPVMVVTAWRMGRDDRREFGRLALPVLAAYLIAGLLIVRTRYLLLDYAAATALATGALVWWQRRSPTRWGPVLHWTFRVLILFGLLDSVRHAIS